MQLHDATVVETSKMCESRKMWLTSRFQTLNYAKRVEIGLVIQISTLSYEEGAAERHLPLNYHRVRLPSCQVSGDMEIAMSRFSRAAGGGAFSPQIRLAVWRKGRVIPGYDPARWRRDACGAVMEWGKYGSLVSSGWEIDHIVPVSRGGSDNLANLQPLQWQNNRRKADNWPKWQCAVWT